MVINVYASKVDAAVAALQELTEYDALEAIRQWESMGTDRSTSHPELCEHCDTNDASVCVDCMEKEVEEKVGEVRDFTKQDVKKEHEAEIARIKAAAGLLH